MYLKMFLSLRWGGQEKGPQEQGLWEPEEVLDSQ